MSIFNIFKKKKQKNDKLAKSIDSFNNLWNMDIKDIWNLEDTNAFISAMNGYICKKCKYGDNLSILTLEEKSFYVVNSFISEVYNGGFEQFLFNSSGALLGDLVFSLSSIGADDIIEIYKEVFKILPKTLPKDESQRDDILFKLFTEDVSKLLADCDEKFYNNFSNLDDMLYQFVINHKENFV